MANQVTITAKAGPAIQATAVVITGVTAINYNFGNQTISVFVSTTPTPQIYDLTGVTTITTTVSGSNYTVAIS
jgi:hypothetical protein